MAHGIMALQLSGLLDSVLAVNTINAGWRSLCIAFGDDPRATDRSLTRARRLAANRRN